MDILDDIVGLQNCIDNIISKAIFIYQSFRKSKIQDFKEFKKSEKFKTICNNQIYFEKQSMQYHNCLELLEFENQDNRANQTGLMESASEITANNSEPYQVEWAFGMNHNIPIYYLDNNIVAYCVSHLVVLHNLDTNAKTFLKGFTNEITTLSTANGLIAAADSGETPCAVILWDIVGNATPKHCWLNPLQGGISLLHVSPNGEYTTAVSRTIPPLIARWCVNGSQILSTTIPVKDSPKHLAGNLESPYQCVVTFSQSIVLVNFENDIQIIHLEQPKTRAKIGHYRRSIFVNAKRHETLSGTSLGFAVVWKLDGKYRKSIQVHKAGISYLQIVNEMCVIACQDGTLWLYDLNLRFCNWFQLQSDSIMSMSFTTNGNHLLPDFAYLTTNQLGIISNSRQRKQHIKYNSSFVTSMEINPRNVALITGDAQGCVSIYDMTSKKLQLKQSLLQCAITVLKFSPHFSALAAGSQQGDLLILDPIVCSIKHVLKSARYSISNIHWSNDELTLCYINRNCSTGLFKFTTNWHLRGKYKTHRGEIVDSVLVGNRLITIGKDRMLVEFDIKYTLRFVGSFVIEDRAIPTCCTVHNNLLLVANSEHRIRWINIENKEIVKTLRSPGMLPLQQIHVIEGNLFYASGKDIGVCALPWQGWGPSIQAHGTIITYFCAFKNTVVTCSAENGAVFMWTFSEKRKHVFPSIPKIFRRAVQNIFQNITTVNKSHLIDHLRNIGFFPSKFDLINILREYEQDEFDIETFCKIVCHHGPPPGITYKEMEQAFLTASDDIRTSGPRIKTETLISSMQSGAESTTEALAFSCLNTLVSPRFCPPNINYQYFINEVIGVANY